MSAPATLSPAPTAAAPAPRVERAQAVWGLTAALLIVVAAWWLGGRAGWDTIGQGGVNMRLLPKVGEKAPDFLTEDVFGNPVRLSDFEGQPVWLMFWGSWGPPCRAEFPDVQAAHETVAPDGVNLLGVSLDESAEAAGTYASVNGGTFLVLSDPDRADTEAGYPIYNFPTHMFVDGEGVVRSIVLNSMSEERAVAEARRLLSPPPPDPSF
ncbi:MAG: redoxin domain-containing protein [Chloroflexia bacterium]|nr:redoxin domain-containing protein [Chloroflexia bacterium]